MGGRYTCSLVAEVVPLTCGVDALAGFMGLGWHRRGGAAVNWPSCAELVQLARQKRFKLAAGPGRSPG